MKTAIIIPARLASTRLPGKPLLDLCGKPLIQHVVERATAVSMVDQVIVATDDAGIFACVEKFGGEARMTRQSHQSGSERVAEVAATLDAEVIINLQGDEPEIDPDHINLLINAQKKFAPFASTLVCPFPKTGQIDDVAAVKVQLGASLDPGVWHAERFSRDPKKINLENGAHGGSQHYLHLGVYAFARSSLFRFAAEPPSPTEREERLEQLRILDMGEKIVAVKVPSSTPGIDTPEDLEAARQRFALR